MFLKSLLLLSTDEIFQPNHSPLAFAREFDLFHLALAQCLDPMIQAAHNELIFDPQAAKEGSISPVARDKNIDAFN
jgi:hypothetical protein